jgi:hypothetical protein
VAETLAAVFLYLPGNCHRIPVNTNPVIMSNISLDQGFPAVLQWGRGSRTAQLKKNSGWPSKERRPIQRRETLPVTSKQISSVPLILAIVIAALGAVSADSFAQRKVAEPELSRALGRVGLFVQLTAKERTALQSAATLRHCKEGERIIEQGKRLDRMFILLGSQAEVNVNGKAVATLPEQSLVGEIEFLDKKPASADVVVSREASLIEIDNAALTHLMQKQPRLGYVFMTEVAKIEAQRLRATNEK